MCTVCGSRDADSFFFFKVSDCIKHLFEVRNLAKVLSGNHPLGTSFCDITDGSEFPKAWENIVKTPIDLTLLGSTDGVQMTHSTHLEF